MTGLGALGIVWNEFGVNLWDTRWATFEINCSSGSCWECLLFEPEPPPDWEDWIRASSNVLSLSFSSDSESPAPAPAFESEKSEKIKFIN